jgi:hypothetical protein
LKTDDFAGTILLNQNWRLSWLSGVTSFDMLLQHVMKFGGCMRTVKTLQSEAQSTSKRKGYSFLGGCVLLLLGLPVLVYYGYCWGIWGKQSLLLQYLFQCNCPTASAEARYPESVDVIVPACHYEYSVISPSGRLLFVREKNSGTTSVYLLNLQTGEKTPSPLNNSGFYFLTDNLLYVSFSYEENFVLDRTTGNRYPVHRFLISRPDAYEGDNANPVLLAETLRQAKYVFFRGQDDTIIALDPDFPTSTDNNFLIERFDIPGENPNRTEQFLKENNIAYEIIYPDFLEDVISPDGRFVARPDGIYLVGTGQKIVEGYSASGVYRGYSRKYFSAKGWTYDSSGVIYSDFLNPCLIETTFFIFDDYTCYLEVPQPLLKLKVPEEYLPPPQTP